MSGKSVRHEFTKYRVTELKMFVNSGKKWEVYEPLPLYRDMPGYLKGSAEENCRALRYAVNVEHLPVHIHLCYNVIFLIRTDI